MAIEKYSMDNRVKREWLKALRSGKYRQGRGQLKEQRFKESKHCGQEGRELKSSFCCLGVLCDIYQKENPSYWDGEAFVAGILTSDKNTSVLPNCVKIWAGLKSSDGRLPLVFGTESLAEMNDNGVGFENIADVIEEAF